MQLWEDRRLPVRLEIDLPPLDRPPNYARARQRGEFALHGAERRARLPNDLAKIECLVGVAEQPAEYAKARPPEKHGGRSLVVERRAWPRTHFAYNRIHRGYDVQARTRRNVETRETGSGE